MTPQIYSFHDLTKHLSLYIVLLLSYNTIQNVAAVNTENGFILMSEADLFPYINLLITVIP